MEGEPQCCEDHDEAAVRLGEPTGAPRVSDLPALVASTAGKIELECVPQGIMVERMRAAAAGMGPFFSPVSYGSKLAEGKETRLIDGKGFVLEQPLPGDYAFVKALEADRWGNLTYRYAGRNFGPVMCMAARTAVVQVDRIVPLGTIPPEHVMTPGIFVKRVVQVDRKEGS